MDSTRIKAVIDLTDYLDSLGQDRPRVSELLKGLNIDKQTAWDSVVATAQSIQMTYPEVAIEICNKLFKLGMTIGYKYAVKKEMERSFPVDDDSDSRQKN
jgi:hypothetical protein